MMSQEVVVCDGKTAEPVLPVTRLEVPVEDLRFVFFLEPGDVVIDRESVREGLKRWLAGDELFLTGVARMEVYRVTKEK